MSNQTTVFDQCATAGEIQAHLQRLASPLIASIQRQPAGRAPGDLSILTKLSYANLKAQQRPVFLLSEICRLLFKLGDQKSLKLALDLSHKIYQFTCRRQESWYIFALYKGIAQIGLGMTDLGIKNVFAGITGDDNFSAFSIDQVLGYWALMSAAIHQKSLTLALSYAKKWQQKALKGDFPGEIFRAGLALLLFQLLLGEQKICRRIIRRLERTRLKEWQNTLDFLTDWRAAMQKGDCLKKRKITEPYPLFLGVEWHDSPDSDFSVLCELRRKLCNETMRKRLSAKKILAYADLTARWELPKPLRELQKTLKRRNVDLYHSFTMSRFLGKTVLRKILDNTPTSSYIEMQDNAIVLVMDVRKFSALSETRAPSEIFAFLNPVFKIMHEELEQAGGTILEFIGDCIIVVFNTFETRQSEISSILSYTVRCLRRLHILNAMSRHIGLPEIHIGVGIHKGPVALGSLGGLQRCHLTALGNTINLASRIESATKELPGHALVSEACFDTPSPDIWTKARQVNFACRDVGHHTMRNIREPVHLFSLRSLLPYWVDFVPMGFTAFPEQGVMYIDAGNSIAPGIIDHRSSKEDIRSSCELLIQTPDLLLNHLQETPISQREFRFHQIPDLDCAASFYAACELLDLDPRHGILDKLALYLHNVNLGRIPQTERVRDSAYGIYKAHTALTQQEHGDTLTDMQLLKAGVRVVDAAFFLMEQYPDEGDFASIFQFRPNWFHEERQWLDADRARYEEDVNLHGHTYTARVNGIAKPVAGLWLDHPQSMFFRIWAWDDPNAPGGKGYPFIALDLSGSGKRRFLIGVDSVSGATLKGLGEVMEEHETRKRKELGKERPIHPIRHPGKNSDPWYFGQGHNYTVIDSPWRGTVLTAEEVQQIHECWQE